MVHKYRGMTDSKSLLLYCNYFYRFLCKFLISPISEIGAFNQCFQMGQEDNVAVLSQIKRPHLITVHGSIWEHC